ncbi:probable folate-biopterin transporter 6 isoform X1 [Cryptomeria japonica]|uniref:probable folate-biopterin transporter 6 isoform X1 n=1 Tax=Cryptomeria japonica TaxID=3369 RepID=UPI0027DAA82C|nr:probable folate-biopterin transporter 6 isoform X1 [Cryptomeria japonica]
MRNTCVRILKRDILVFLLDGNSITIPFLSIYRYEFLLMIDSSLGFEVFRRRTRMKEEEEAIAILVNVPVTEEERETDVLNSSCNENEVTSVRHWSEVVCSPWEFVKSFLQWFAVMREAFGGPFLGVVMVVYGVSQGYAETMKRLATNYYWRDVQKMQPASTQVLMALSTIPWDIKPIYGLITDTFPIAGYRRWPYLAICGIIGCLCLWALSFFELVPWMATLLMAGVAMCTAFPDVVTDATVAQQSKTIPKFASDLQSLSWGSMAVGGLFGCGVSGAAVHELGPQSSYLLVSIAPLMLIVAALALPESRSPKTVLRIQFGALMHTLRLFGKTLRDPTLWRPALYIYLSQGSLCPDISEAMFFWLTDPEAGPGFSEEFMGFVNAVGYLAMFIGIVGYNHWFRCQTFRKMFLWSQVTSSFIGLLDIIIVCRMNLRMHIPDRAFVLGDQALTDAISKIQLMPMLVLSSQLCPIGIEGTVFAFLMSVSNFGSTSGTWLGALLLKWLHIQRDDYSRLWLAVLIRSLMRLSPLFFIFLVPDCTVENIRPLNISLTNDLELEESTKDIMPFNKVSVHELDE